MSDTFSVIPEPRHRARCQTCLCEGYVEVEDCTCGGAPGAEWFHLPHCGVVPCPEGCGDE